MLKSDFPYVGREMSEKLGKKLVDSMESNPAIKEQYSTFKEDNTMDNSSAFYTTVLAKAIYYKSLDKFEKYFDLVWNLTPADLGQPEGAGSYQIPKIQAAVAVKLSSGEAVSYVNDNKSSVTLETETFGVGTRINRRGLKRFGPGVIDKLLTSASDAVLRAEAQDMINGMVSGANTSNTVATGISYDAIEDAVKNVKLATDTNGIVMGLVPDRLVFTTLGSNVFKKSTDGKLFFQYGQRNVPGKDLELMYHVYDGMKVVHVELISVQKSNKDVHGLVLVKDDFLAHLKETEMEVFDGRIPGTAGDVEIIHALDAGSVVINDKACAVITAA